MAGGALQGGAEATALAQDKAAAEARCAALEAELRKSKRREEKLQVSEAGGTVPA